MKTQIIVVIALITLSVNAESEYICFGPNESDTETIKLNVCEECEDIVKKTQAMFDNPTFVKDLKLLLDTVCYQLPAPYDRLCTDMINKFTDSMIEKYLEWDSHELCENLGLCSF